MNNRIALVLALAASPGLALAAGKKPETTPTPIVGKKVVVLHPIAGVKIELPDNEVKDLGEDFKARLTTKLFETGRFLIADPEPAPAKPFARALRSTLPPDYVWPGTFVPAADLKIRVNAYSFSTGERGTRMFYGLDERMHTPYNDGTLANEYPLPSGAFNGWFGSAFAKKGEEPTDSRSGLDLGEGLSINVLFAWLDVKYARYFSRLSFTVEVDSPLGGRHVSREISVEGKGFFFDVAGAYQNFSAGIKIARRDALLQSFLGGVEGAVSAIDATIGDLPFTARVDARAFENEREYYLLGTGHQAYVPVGTRFEVAGAPGVLLEVAAHNNSGAIARLVEGNSQSILIGAIAREPRPGLSPLPGTRAMRGMSAALSAPTLLDPAQVTLPEQDLKRPDFKPGTIENISKARAIALSIVQMITLPYRVWRYQQYDRAYQKEPDPSKGKAKTLDEWVAHMRAQPWSKQMGLDRVPVAPKGEAPLVAILDSGVDYNHPVLHRSLWLNPSPTRDAQGREDRYGWDFISGDSRPNDDSYHGTQMASVILSVAPHARILPVKIFNPYGHTSSAAIVAGVRYALDQGAKILLCGWSTLRKSTALEEAAKLAEEYGAVLVVSAGDFGWDLSVFPAYPSTLTRKFASVVSVAALGRDGKLLNETAPIKPDPKAPHARKASYGKDFVTLAAPGQRVDVAEPRGEFSVESSSSVAAAFVAGALARVLTETGARTAEELREGLERVSIADPMLTDVVQEGRRLQF